MRNAVFMSSSIAASCVAAFLFAATPALAMDPVCQTLVTLQENAAKVPTHMYMTSEDKFSGGLTKAAGSMGMTGVKKAEEISTGKDVYVLEHGKWIDMQTSFAEMAKQNDPNDPDTKKIREAQRCKILADDVVSGEPATVYQSNNSEAGIDTKIWISKASKLPLKSEIVNKASDQMTGMSTQIYEYKNVQAPVGAISMKQMMQERSKH